MLAPIAELEKNQKASKSTGVSFKVSPKGAVSAYGLGCFPVTLYYEQWQGLLDRQTTFGPTWQKNKNQIKLKAEDSGSHGRG